MDILGIVLDVISIICNVIIIALILKGKKE